VSIPVTTVLRRRSISRSSYHSGIVDRHRRFREFPLGELLDQNAVVQGFPLLRENDDFGVRIGLPDRFGRGGSGDAVTDNDVGRTHTSE